MRCEEGISNRIFAGLGGKHHNFPTTGPFAIKISRGCSPECQLYMDLSTLKKNFFGESYCISSGSAHSRSSRKSATPILVPIILKIQADPGRSRQIWPQS
jgi:hypothetical protein